MTNDSKINRDLIAFCVFKSLDKIRKFTPFSIVIILPVGNSFGADNKN